MPALSPPLPAHTTAPPPPSDWPTFSLTGLRGEATLRTHPLGFKQIWPRPSADDLKRLYRDDFYDKMSPKYLAKMQRDQAFWDATWSLRRQLMEEALPTGTRRILDIGASSGFLLDHFKRNHWEVAGIEPSRSAVEWASEHLGIELFCGELLDYADAPSNLADSTADGAANCAAAGRFDAIHSAQVLEHVLSPEHFIECVAGLLAPHGVVYIEVPNDFNAFQEVARQDLEKPSWWVAPDVHLNYFDADSLSALLASKGLIEFDRLASFPMEIFLLMGEDYVGHPEIGDACHAKRMRFEQTLIREGRNDALLRFYRALGQANLGRTAGILARKA